MPEYVLTIGGQAVSPSQTFDVLNPLDESIVARCPRATTEHVDLAVRAARQALPKWAAMPAEGRVARLLDMAGLIERNHAELATLVTREQGKPQSGPGANLEVGGAAVWTRTTAGLSLAEDVIQDDANARIVARRKPVGVV